MKNIQYNIRLNVIVPCITAGIAVLTFIVAFQITKYYIGKGDADYIGIVIVYGVVATVISLMTGILITRILLKPMQQFIENAKQLPAIASQVISSGKEKNVDELKHFCMIFEQVAEVLSKVESRQFFPDITGESRAIRGVLNQIIKVAPTDSTVLVYGESGTGKELVAKNIYEHSIRKDKAFVKINCVAIPEELLESELFGHEKGSFTGASSRKLGKFEIADGGTIFLDEIGDMSLRLQAKILRVLQEREFDRVGGTNPIKVDVRFIAATNKNLEELVKDGKFREDLFYRLNVFVINIPPLRNRIEDIPLLVDSFYENSSLKHVKLSPKALSELMDYSWPGNIRELQNVIERAMVLCEDGSEIESNHLPSNIANEVLKRPSQIVTDFSPEENSEGIFPIDEELRKFEKSILIGALRKAGGVQIKAAKLLGINARSVAHRIKKHNITASAYKTTNYEV